MTVRRWRLIAVTVWVCACLAVPDRSARGDDPDVRVVVLCGPQRTYRQAASALRDSLASAGCQSLLVELPKNGEGPILDEALRQLVEANPTVIAAAGSNATSLALATVPDVPVVFFAVPNVLDAEFSAPGRVDRGRVAGVAADVSPAEQIAWITRLHPQARKLGLLHSRRTRLTAEAISRAAAQRGISVATIESDKGEFAGSIDALNQQGVDGVLMIPDAKVYNSASVQRLLLWGIRQKKPVWAFSAGVVKAGALGGQFADNQAVGEHAAELIQQVIRSEPVGKLGVQYPRKTGRAVNERTAEIVSINLADDVLVSATRFGATP